MVALFLSRFCRHYCLFSGQRNQDTLAGSHTIFLINQKSKAKKRSSHCTTSTAFLDSQVPNAVRHEVEIIKKKKKRSALVQKFPT